MSQRQQQSRVMPLLACVLVSMTSAACAEDQGESSGTAMNWESIDTLITTESELLGGPSDLDVAPDGSVYVLDYQVPQVIVSNPGTAESRVIGRKGAGPGEFDDPTAIAVYGDSLLILDRGNGRIQALDLTGTYIGAVSIPTHHASVSMGFLLPGGGLLVGTLGRDSALALRYDPAGDISGRYGPVVVPPPTTINMRSVKEAIENGEVPDDFRNMVLVAEEEGGAVWLALQSEGIVRRYDPSGQMEFELAIDEPEFIGIRQEFFDRNTMESPFVYPLMYFADADDVGDEFWLLLNRRDDQGMVVLTVSADGARTRRLSVDSILGATAFAFDEENGRLYVADRGTAQLFAVKVNR